MMPVAPGDRPRASGEDAVPVARFERAPGRRRKGAAGVIELTLQLALAGDPADGAVTGVALDSLGWDCTATLELARRRALDHSQGVEARADDQLRPRSGPIALAPRATLPAEFDKSIGAALAVVAQVVLDRLHKRLQGRSQRRAALDVEHAVEPDQAVLRLRDVEIASLVRVVRFGESAGRIDAVLEVLRDGHELPGIHRLGRPE